MREAAAEDRGTSGSIRRFLGLVLGPALLLTTIIVPAPTGMSDEAWRVAGVGLLMAVWWVMESIPIPATALLPIVLLPVLSVSTVEQATAPFANPVIFLFLGGFMIAQAMQRWELHRRLAFAIIDRTGTAPLRLVAGFMAAAAFLSMWVSNTAVAVMMLPIGVSVIQVIGGEQKEPGVPPGDPAFAVALLLGIAYGSSIGGTATLIGTPPNALLAGFLQQEFGLDIGFGRWLLVGLPVALILLPIAWFLLTRVAFPVDPAGKDLPSDVLASFRASLGPRSRAETRVAWVFGATALAWILRPILETWLPGLSDAGIAIAATLALFLLPSGSGRAGAILNWDWAKRIPWDVLLLFGGGLSLAGAISSSGLAEWIGTSLQAVGALPILALMFLVTILLIFLTELTSNTASAAAFIPILAGLALVIGAEPLLLIVPATLAASCAFMLPVATPPNAIVFGSTFIRMGHMVKAGILLNIVAALLLPLITFVMLNILFGALPDLPITSP
jgi:solute carrier family 13 (sodium-dependent dicarboxylate transporter), member 2/3/5